MAISFVGSNTLDQTTSTSTLVVSLPSGLQQNDVVYVLTDNQNGSNPDLSEDSGTWTELADLYQNDNTDINLGLWRKVMGATPDTSISISQPTNNHWVAIAVAFRGVDTTNPEDVAVVTDGGVNSPDPNCPSITPVSDNCWILAFGASSEPTGTLSFPTGYSNTLSVQSTGNSGTVFFASKALGAAAAEDPVSFDTTGGSAADSWGAVTVALRPAASSGISGSLSATLGAVTSSATGTLAIAGTLSKTLAAVTSSATGKLAIAGSASKTLGTLTATATGALAISGSLSATLADLTATGSGAAGEETSPEETPEQPSSGGAWRGGFRTPADILRQRRREREELDLTESEQRKIDRAAKKIAKVLPKVGLNAPLEAQEAIQAQPAFDQLLMALRPSEGEIRALAQAILDRIAYLSELAAMQQDEEEQIVALMMEM